MKSYYSIDEAAECTGIGRNTLRKLIEWKKLPVLKVGRKLLIRADTIETFMELNEGNTSAMNLILRSSMRTLAESQTNLPTLRHLAGSRGSALSNHWW
ncbi:MAG: helix-turn-helix domain-containing protein [Lachnospiraceae bacterium]|nr:helix-turn-helix domain-containing protein [Lachnospiraceae bacterium]